jgi:ABC-2 type transport system permease protein
MKTNKSMLNMLDSDFFKLSKLKSVIIAPIVILVFILIYFALFKWQSDFLGTMTQPMLEDASLKGKDFLFGAATYPDIGLFVAIIAGIYIGGEFSTGIMRTVIARGASRLQIYFSKLIAVITLSVAYTAFAFIICGILTAIIGYGEEFTALQFGLLVRSFVLQALVVVSLSSIFVMLSFLLRTQGAAIGVSLAVYFVVSLLVGIASAVAAVIGEDAQWLAETVKYIPSSQLSVAAYYGTYKIADLMRVIFVPIGYIIISTVIGVLTMLKRDVK